MGSPWLIPPPSAAPGSVTAPSPIRAAAGHPAPSDEELDRLLKSGFASEIKVDRVIVPAVVVDRKGRPVHGLKAADFRLSEDRVLQKIDYFHVDPAEPLSIAFLLDVSGSMRILDKIGEAREAIWYFLDTLAPQDQAQVLTFADDRIETLAPFGTDPVTIRERLEATQAYGQTALHDAIAAAPGLVDAQRAGRKAIVLITDGVDNFSKLTLEEGVSDASRVDVPIYAIAFDTETSVLRLDAPGEGTNAELLRTIAEQTGGGFFRIHDPDEMKEAVRAIEEDLRSQYVLGYTPPRVSCKESFRTIELKTDRSRYRVRTRKGYFAGPC